MKNPNILIIGSNSVLAQNYVKLSKIKGITVRDRSTLDNLNFEKFTHIINFSLDPDTKNKKVKFKSQLDLIISKKIKDKNIIYIIPSTRQVYSSIKKSEFSERQKLNKIDNIYGKNKREIEMKVRNILKNKVLIIRISTLLFFDLSTRNLFISRVLRSLKKNKKIYFDIGPDTAKDFITISKFSYALDKLIIKRKTGIFNLSSGLSIKIKLILQKILEGYGNGVIKYKNYKNGKSYYLNNKKLSKNIKFSVNKKHILDYCKILGKNLNA